MTKIPKTGGFRMNRNSSGSLVLSKALVGYLYFKTAEGLSIRSLISYERILKKWIEYCGDVEIKSVTSKEIIQYLSWLRTDYVPQRLNGAKRALSPKTLRNIWITLSSFFSWASQEFGILNPVKDVPAPRFQKAPVDAFTQKELGLMLKACLHSRESDTNFRRKFVMKRPSANRDQAIILMLLDTGLRASELCALTIGDVDVKRGKVDIRHGVQGGAKGGKGRIVFLGKTTRRTLWRYLVEREDIDDLDAPLFAVRSDRKFSPDTLRHLIKNIAKRAGVKNAYPHKFRHTFSITYLRSGGDVFTLQALLGHSSLDMVRYYAQVAQVDVEKAHRKASPADNWRL